jgi:predicted PurR-regulated permease PerM
VGRRAGDDVSGTVPPPGPEGSPEPGGWTAEVPPWARRAVVVVVLAVAGYQIVSWAFANVRGLLGLIFLAWLFAVSVEPVVERLVHGGLRRGSATGLVFFGLTAMLVGFLVLFGALLVDQLAQLLTAAPDVVGDAVVWANRTFGTTLQAQDIVDSLQLTPARLQQLAQDLTPGLVHVLTQLAGVLIQLLTFTVFAFYMSAQGPAMRTTVTRLFPPRHQHVISTVWEIAVEKTGGYIISRLVLAVLSAVFTGVFLLLLGVPFWLPLALWTGVVSQFIPTFGTYLAIAVPALVALSGRPLDALWVVIFGILYQQVENYLFSPHVTARTVDIHPAVALGSVLAGAGLFGPTGALVAIPVVAAVQAVVETYGHRYDLASEHQRPPARGHGRRLPSRVVTSAAVRRAWARRRAMLRPPGKDRPRSP